MSQIAENKFDSREALFKQLFGDVMAGLSSAVAQRSQASMLLSGGTSPGALYGMMSKEALDWNRVWFGLSDERWVASDHADSNEKLVRETLLANKAAKANFIGIKSPGDDVAKGQAVSHEQLLKLPRPFDITLLGMGLDGHTASLFPDSADITAALSDENKMLCQPIRRGVGEVPRMSMTLNALLSSREIKLLIFGADKWHVYAEALARKSDHQPVSHILHQNKVPVSLYWAP